ncbi:hypothetical protein BC826DRAFT_678282 [Russula brevipes]|nr:hypothetical protein BC826DRAFT_678282 [Russula brevipes]
MSDKKLWCIVEGDKRPFKASISQSEDIDDLQKVIYTEINTGAFLDVSPKDLVLWKPKETIPLEDPDNGEPYNNDLARRISNLGNFSQFAEELNPIKKVGHYFGNQDGDSLSVIIQLPNSDTCDTCPMQAVPREPEDELEKYEEIFVNARDWGTFCEEDIAANDIHDYFPNNNTELSLPDFVTISERILEGTPSLDSTWLESPISAPLRPYFELIGDSIADGMTTRRAELLEAAHTLFLTVCEWEKCWQGGPKGRRKLKEQLMNTMFFELPVDRLRPSHTSGMVSAQLNGSWPLKVVVKREDPQLGNNPQQKERLRQYTPRSDFLVSHATLPRLLVEVNSTSLNSNPPDLCRMLITGAYIVRFANNFVGHFKRRISSSVLSLFGTMAA